MAIEFSDDATPLDLNEMNGCLLPHVTTRQELDRWEQENINEAYVWLEKTRKKELINPSFICLLHKKMFGSVWKWAGQYRKSDKNIGVVWQNVPVSLLQLCGDVQYWIDEHTFSNDEIAVRFHHRLVYIHPFSNGNGRHARLMTDLLLERVLRQKAFTWGGVSLVDKSQTRKRYIEALKAADANDFTLLLSFVRT